MKGVAICAVLVLALPGGSCAFVAGSAHRIPPDGRTAAQPCCRSCTSNRQLLLPRTAHSPTCQGRRGSARAQERHRPVVGWPAQLPALLFALAALMAGVPAQVTVRISLVLLRAIGVRITFSKRSDTSPIPTDADDFLCAGDGRSLSDG